MSNVLKAGDALWTWPLAVALRATPAERLRMS